MRFQLELDVTVENGDRIGDKVAFPTSSESHGDGDSQHYGNNSQDDSDGDTDGHFVWNDVNNRQFVIGHAHASVVSYFVNAQ